MIAIIQNLSLKRLTDQEIAEYLHNEKQIEIARSTVTNTRNRVEKQAAKWYLDLKQSSDKFIAAYKQRIDSLFSYQKKLHEIIAATKKDEVKIRAISELHSIEMDIFSLWKQLPQLETDNNNSNTTVEQEGLEQQLEHPPLLVSGNMSVEEQAEAKEQEARERLTYFGWKNGDPPLDGDFRDRMEDRYGVDIEPWDDPKWIQCSECERWFRNRETIYYHICVPREDHYTKLSDKPSQ